RMVALLVPHGIRVVRLDLRGCGAGARVARRTYNGGCSSDVRAAAAAIHRADPSCRILLLGFSLGGNIVLKLAGEAAADPVPGLTRVAAVAPPIDLVRASELISRPRNRGYELYFLRDLLALVNERRRCFPDVPPVQFPRRLT